MGIAKISKIIFIKNRKSGSSFLIDRLLSPLVECIKQEYPLVEISEVGLQDIASLEQYCSNFISGEALFVACGGDGTVTYLAESIYKSKVKNYLSVIPFGTGNDFSREIGIHLIRKDTKLLVEAFLGKSEKSVSYEIPLWQFDDQVFLNYLSIGYDAQVAYCFDYFRSKLPKAFNRPFLNKCLYGVAGIFCFSSGLKKGTVEIKANGQVSTLNKMKLLVFGNINSYAGGYRLVKSRLVGKAELLFLKIPTLMSYIKILKGKGWFESKVESLLEFKIKVNKKSYAQLDGEPFEINIGEYQVKMLDRISVLGWNK